MANRRLESEARITASVLDRLVDFDPDAKQEARSTYSTSLRELKHSVRRDLEWLLNSRRIAVDIEPGLEEVAKSVIMYGLPDFMGASGSAASQEQDLTAEIKETLRLFAPQLIDVKVSFSPPDKVQRSILFRIEARIDVEPTPEPIVFDTVLQLGSGEFGVKEKV